MDSTARIGFAGSPEFAATVLQGLLKGGYRPTLVLSQPPRPRGRSRKPIRTAVAELANVAQLAIDTPLSLKPVAAVQTLAEARLDLLIVAAYGLILPQAVLDLPTFGCLNVHASLLPRWRGAAPVERALLAGDRETGVALMQMDAGLDTGAVHAQHIVSIGERTTGGELEVALAEAGVTALLELLPRLEQSTPTPQSEIGITYAHKLTAADSQINWQNPAMDIARQIRALMPRQPAQTRMNDLRLKVLAADVQSQPAQQPPGSIEQLDKQGLSIATGDQLLRLTKVQLNRGKGQPLDGNALRNGYAELLAPGLRFDPVRE